MAWLITAVPAPVCAKHLHFCFVTRAGSGNTSSDGWGNTQLCFLPCWWFCFCSDQAISVWGWALLPCGCFWGVERTWQLNPGCLGLVFIRPSLCRSGFPTTPVTLMEKCTECPLDVGKVSLAFDKIGLEVLQADWDMHSFGFRTFSFLSKYNRFFFFSFFLYFEKVLRNC